MLLLNLTQVPHEVLPEVCWTFSTLLTIIVLGAAGTVSNNIRAGPNYGPKSRPSVRSINVGQDNDSQAPVLCLSNLHA